MSIQIVIDPPVRRRTPAEVAAHRKALRSMTRVLLRARLDAAGVLAVSSALVALQKEASGR